jgi:uncharacterized membrane protein YhdT
MIFLNNFVSTMTSQSRIFSFIFRPFPPPFLPISSHFSDLPQDANVKYAQKKVKKAQRPNNYIPQLILAISMVLMHIATITSTIIMLTEWFDISALKTPAIVIAVCYIWKGFTQMFIGFTSYGPLALIMGIFDILQLSELYYFVKFVVHFSRHQGQTVPWKRCYYLPHQSLASFSATIPSLVLQTFVMIKRPELITSAQYVAMICGAIFIFLSQISAFHYITVSPRIYYFMMVLSIFSKAIRIIAVAFLIHSIKAYAFIYWGASYLLGIVLVVYFAFHRKTKLGRDDPLQLSFLKVVYIHQLSLQLTCNSTPFAAQHSVFEWWYGHILSECKMIFEYGVAVALVALLYPFERNTGFYFIYALALFAIIVHVGLLFFINMVVSRSLRRRSLFSTTKIVTFFVYFGDWLQVNYIGKQADGGLDDKPKQKTDQNKDEDKRESAHGWTSMQQDKKFEQHVLKTAKVDAEIELELMTSGQNMQFDDLVQGNTGPHDD